MCDCLYMLVMFDYVICGYVMVGWVEAVLLCVEGQQTQGGPDRLKACEANQSG